MSAPSAWRVEMAMAAAQSFAARMRADDPETDHEALLLALDSETDVFDVLRRVVRAAHESKSFAVSAGARANEIQARADLFSERSKELRGVAIAMLEALELTKFTDPEFTLSVRPGNERCFVADEARLPDEFFRIERKPDLTLINAARKQGETPAGVSVERGLPVLTIRTK